jgi:hypothetical protein
LIDLDQLKAAVEGLADPATLDDHPLTTTRFIDCYRQHHPEVQTLTAGEVLGRVLAETWRQQCLPPTMNARLRREWNLFLTLEVGYFFPFRHRRRLPGGLAQLGALLVDRDHVALVIADGDERRAQTLRHSDYADFWEMLAPTNKKETLALGITTMAARRDTALRRLAQELKRIEDQPSAVVAANQVDPVVAEHGQPGMARTEPIDTLALYREQVCTTAPRFIPEEWKAIIKRVDNTSQWFITGPAGSGKTELMHAIAYRLCQTEVVPLYLRLTDYVSHASQQDVLQFAASQGGFGQLYRAEEVRRDFEQRLAETQRMKRLIVLVDQVDDLTDEELHGVSQRLAPFSRLILAERTPRLSPLCGIECRQPMPDLSRPTATQFLQSHGYDDDMAQQYVTQFQQWQIPLQPDLLRLMAQTAPNGQRHPVLVVQQWITDQIAGTRSTGTASAKGDQARRLLRYLAGVKHDVAPHPGASTDLTRENVRRAFWSLTLTPDKEEQGWSLIEFCCRTGIIELVQSRWEFTQSAIEQALAAEFISEETHWVSLRPCQRDLMRWTAALISRRGTAQRQQTFILELRRALASASRLSALEAADVLAEWSADQTAETQAFRTEVLEQLQGLSAIGSRRLSEIAQAKAERLEARQATVDGVSTVEASPGLFMSAEQLQRPAHTLAEVLNELRLPVPAGAEEGWLEDRRVLRGLIDGLCQATTLEMKRDCAAWLDGAPLTKVLEVHVPEQRWWKSRPRSALEIVAQRALQAEGDELTRYWLYSVLAREERVLQLWQHGDEYLPLVYELLLALDQRLFLITGLLTRPEWHITR